MLYGTLRLAIPAAAAAVVLLGACGSDSDSSGASDPTPTDQTTVSASDTQAPSTETSSPEQAESPAVPTGNGTATVTLENGSTYEFSILCTLESQVAAGQTISFTVTSYDDPVNLDVTQFGDESFDGAASISLYDSTSYETLWEANSMFGNDVELTLDGSTVSGSGTFVAGDDGMGDQVAGDLVANC